MAQPQTLPELLDAAAARYGSATALIFEDRRIPYAELRDRVTRAAASLEARGIKKGDCVVIVHRNSPDFVVAYFALNRLGAVAVPVNFMVTKPGELAFILNDCKAVGIVTQKEFHLNLLSVRGGVPSLKHFWTTDMDAPPGAEDFRGLQRSPGTPGAAAPGAEDNACILYTSGTTGNPKGVMLTHRNLVSNASASAEAMELTHKDVFLCILPMFHTFAWTACVVIPVFLGASVVVIPSLTPPKPWLQRMARYGVTLFAAVPQLYSVLAKEAKGLKGLVLKWWFFRKVRYGVSGSAPLALETLQAFEAGLGVPILEGFGMTETSPVTTVNRPGRRKPGAVGLPIRDVRVRIVDDAEAELPVGQEGEICVQGPNVMKGYFGNPEATREAFTKDGWLKTGDIGVFDDEGFLYIRDRKKDMIIVKGLKVYPAMIERELLALPGVEEAAVIGVPSGDGDELIKAFLVPRKGETIDKASVQKFLKEKFDPYKRPRDVEVVESLPKNALQKVLKRVLRQAEIEKLKARA